MNGNIYNPLCINYNAKGDFYFEKDRQSNYCIFSCVFLYGRIVAVSVLSESRVVKTKKEYRNVYITDVKQQKVEGIWRGQKKTWQLRSAVSKEKISGVADLIEEQGKVVKVRKKPDMIQGKILRIMDKKLQIENYGFVSLDAEFCVYHLK